MKTVVLDTNILLDVFVFCDKRAVDLKRAILQQEIVAIASPKTLEELTDVIARPLFKLDIATQNEILTQWKTFAKIEDDLNLARAPWECEDIDDQIFLDLAYRLKPAMILSKDNALLKLAKHTASAGILITEDYNAFKLQS